MRLNLLRALATAVALVALPAVSLADIAGTAHDFSGSGWTSEICVVCHTPHNSDTTVAAAPLWNHAVTGSTFTLYSSDTLNATMGQPDGVSKLCLSCHDGQVAVDSFGGATGTTSIATTSPAYVGIDLTDDHPVSFTYDATLVGADNGLHPTSNNSGLGGTIAQDMLFADKVQCGSCHDPHGVPGVDKFLLKSNVASDLCLTCHNK